MSDHSGWHDKYDDGFSGYGRVSRLNRRHYGATDETECVAHALPGEYPTTLVEGWRYAQKRSAQKSHQRLIRDARSPWSRRLALARTIVWSITLACMWWSVLDLALEVLRPNAALPSTMSIVALAVMISIWRTRAYARRLRSVSAENTTMKSGGAI